MKVFKDIEQWTQEWLKLKGWVLSWTWLKDIMSGKFKVDWSPDAAMRSAMLWRVYKLLWWEFSFDENAPWLWGYLIDQWNELEPIARAKFEDKYNKKVEEIWFCKREDWLWLSPDWLIKTWEMDFTDWIEWNIRDVYWEAIEIKCPMWDNSANFYKYKFQWITALRKDKAKYIWQVVHNFIVNEDLEKLYFIVYNPNINAEMQIHVIEITREELEEEINDCEKRIKEFRKIWEEHIVLLLK